MHKSSGVPNSDPPHTICTPHTIRFWKFRTPPILLRPPTLFGTPEYSPWRNKTGGCLALFFRFFRTLPSTHPRYWGPPLRRICRLIRHPFTIFLPKSLFLKVFTSNKNFENIKTQKLPDMVHW